LGAQVGWEALCALEHWELEDWISGRRKMALCSRQQSNTGRYELWCEMNLAAYRKLFAIPLVLLADSWLLGSP
jgi:hypothetical protein